MVRDADDRVVEVVVAVGPEVSLIEAWSLDDDATILGADIEAGTDLVRDAGAVERADIGAAAQALQLRLLIVKGVVDVAADTGFEKRVEVAEGEAVHVGPGDFL